MPDPLTFAHYQVARQEDGSPAELGRGAMGITYRAMDTQLRIPVALKVIATPYLESETARSRFVREARSAARLRHRHVASVFHLGQEGGSWFYAMEFIDGETLEALIKRQGPLRPGLALQITDQVARALRAAQAHGLVHRDLKPANLMLVREDDELIVKVIDFGLARATLPEGEEAVTISMSGFVGTPHFAAPEQLEEKEVDVRTDIYSLGVTLWYMLAGRAPFAGTMAQVMSQQLSKAPPFEQLGTLPPPLHGLLERMLAKAPADRPPTPERLREEIRACREALEEEAAPLPLVGTPVADAEGDFATVLAEEPAAGPPSSPLSPPAAPPPLPRREPEWQAGSVVAGRFRLLVPAEASTWGPAFRAFDEEAAREVRLVQLPELSPERLALQKAEWARWQSLEHPQALRCGGVVSGPAGRAYLALELGHGFTLLELLRTRRALPAREVLPLLRQAAAGLDAETQAGWLRRKLPPREVLLTFSAEQEVARLLPQPVETWPALTVKLFPPARTAQAAGQETWSGGQTMAGAAPAAPAAVSPVPVLARLAYEVLGGRWQEGAERPFAFSPLAPLSEEGNGVLRQALESPSPWAASGEFVEALARTVAPGGRAGAAEPARKAAPLAGPEVAGPRPWLPVGLAAGAAVLLLVAGWWGLHPPAAAPATPGPRAVEPSTPAPLAPEPVATPAPAATPAPTPPPDPLPAFRVALAKAGELEEAHRWAEALEAYVTLAENGDLNQAARTRAELLLSRLDSMPAELSEAERASLRPALLRAARAEVLWAMVMLGEEFIPGTPEERFAWCSAAAARGHAPSQSRLGLMLSKGYGAPVDLPRAVACFEEAAAQGDGRGQLALGECLLRGKGIASDPGRGMHLLQEAAEGGLPEAMSKLGDYSKKGLGGLTRDLAAARHLFEQAVALNYPEAMANLGILYLNGEGVLADPARAADLFLRGAKLGHPYAMFLLATTIESGAARRMPRKEAEGWYQRAAEAGEPNAARWCDAHGVLYRRPVPR